MYPEISMGGSVLPLVRLSFFRDFVKNNGKQQIKARRYTKHFMRHAKYHHTIQS